MTGAVVTGTVALDKVVSATEVVGLGDAGSKTYS